MRIARSLVLLAAAVVAWNASVLGQRVDAGQVLAAAREALGGDATLAAVKTFVATGRTRQLRGSNLVPIEFEIACELPDRFVRKDEFPAQDTDLTVTGFRGDELIQGPAPAQGRGGQGPPPQQRLTSIKQDFVRLTLGVFAASFPSYPLTFKYAAAGEAPEGKADVLDVAGPANFSARFVVQQETHLPVMLMWEAPAAGPGGRGPGAGGGRGPGVSGAPPQPLPNVAYRIYYADYRSVNGVKWPFRIRRAVSGTTVEETTFDRVSINVKIDPRKFEAPK